MNYICKKSRVLSAVLAFFLFIMVCIPTTVYAEGNANVTISADKTKVEAGDKVKVTVTVTADGTLDKVNYALVYDKAVLSIKDSEGYDFNGKVKWSAIEVGSGKYVESFTFTALADGTASVRFENTPEVSGFVVTAGDPCVITVGSGAAVPPASSEQPDESTEPSSDAEVSVVIPNSSEPQTEESTEPEVIYGSCDLKTLIIQPGSIEFDPEVTDYVVQVDAGTNRMLVQAETADPTSQYVVSGFESLVDGEENLVSIIVTSTAGETKTYNLHVLCGDVVYYEDFEVTIGEKVYTVKEFPSAGLVPSNFTEASLTIGENAVNAYQNQEMASRGLYMIYAAEGEGAGVICWYDSNDGSIFPYVEVGNPEAESKLAEVQNAYANLAEKYNKDMSFRMKIIIGLVIVVAFVLIITIVQMIKIHRMDAELDALEEEAEKEVFAAKKKEPAKKESAAPMEKAVKKEETKVIVKKPVEKAVKKEMEAADMDTEDISAAILATMNESVIPTVSDLEEEIAEEEEEFFFEEVKKVTKRAVEKEAPKAEAKAPEVTGPRRPTRERPMKPQVTRKKED